MDGFLRLTHAFCLERSNSEQAGPPGTSVYTASQARLGGPIFTPRCFPKKTSSRGPLSKVQLSEKQPQSSRLLLSHCVLQPHTYGNNTHPEHTGERSVLYLNRRNSFIAPMNGAEIQPELLTALTWSVQQVTWLKEFVALVFQGGRIILQTASLLL